MQLLKDSFGWGLILWLIGYILGIILFFVLPPSMIGWVITPIGTAIALWVLLKKVTTKILMHYIIIGIVWVGIAIVLDYFFIVKMFNPSDGYYKPDIYIYYAVAFALPVFMGWRKTM